MQKIKFKRKAYKQLQQWKNESSGKTALLVEGARRIGKSTLVEEFAKKEYKSYILIDFANAPKEINTLIETYINDLDYFFLQLQFIYKVQLYKRQSLIIFDEVQKQPLARQAIKYLVKDGRYDYIETGSLISIRKNIKDIVIPSEEDRIQMYPMDYEEYLWALGDTSTIPLLKEIYHRQEKLGEETHRRLMRDFRLYMLIGGMPQAVAEYLSTNNLQKVDKVKRRILTLYADDLRKIDNSDRLRTLFWSIPAELHKNISRYQMTTIVENTTTEKRQELLESLRESMIANVAYRSNDPNVGLHLTADKSKYKMYLADTGLFVTLAFWDKDFTENIIYQKLLNDKLSVNLGYVYENAIAQIIRSSGNELYYYSFTNENRNQYEIDFLLSRGNKIIPVEVKSSNYKTHKSLDLFCEKFSSRISDRILLYSKDYKKIGAIKCLPMYLASFL